MERKKVLFVCTYQGARSRIAEEFANRIALGRIEAYSSCFDPGRIDPLPIDVMREVGIDLPAESPKPVFTRHKEGDVFDYVIAVCYDASREQCPLFRRTIDVLYARKAKTMSWSIPDFKWLSGTEEKRKAGARKIRDKIKSKVVAFLAKIGMNLRIDEEKNIAYIGLSGILSKEIIFGAFDLAVSDKRYKNGMGRLWYFKDADLSSLDAETITELGQHSLKYPPGINDVKVAFVTDKNFEYGLTRMYEISSKAMTPIQVFRSMDEAEKWMME